MPTMFQGSWYTQRIQIVKIKRKKYEKVVSYGKSAVKHYTFLGLIVLIALLFARCDSFSEKTQQSA